MKIHVLTLFPEMIENGLNVSITGRAMARGILSVRAVNIRDFAGNKHGKVDDYPYGGGAGMLMQAEPVYQAWKSVAGEISGGEPDRSAEGPAERQSRRVRTIYLTPQGRTFDQAMAEELAREEELIFLCGHYEGIDERVLEEIVTDPVSIGDYVLTGGELPAMVMIDAISRLVEGVLHNGDSALNESFSGSLLEYPQYSRPEVWRGRAVPSVLLSGHHANVEKWRRQQSVLRTARWRPDLLARAELTEQEKQMLKGEETMFEDLSKKLGDLAQNMVKKTGEVAEIASLRTKVLTKKKKAEDELAALGKAYYEAHKDSPAEFSEKIVAVNDIYNEIAALEEEIRILKEKLPEDERKAAEDVMDVAADVVEDVKDAAGDVAEAAAEKAEDVEKTTEE